MKLLFLLSLFSVLSVSASQKCPTTPPDKDKTKRSGLRVYQTQNLECNRVSQR